MEIFHTQARIDDAGAMATFTAPIPTDLISALDLKESCFVMEYEDETRTLRWVGTDCRQVVCFTLTDISAPDAAKVQEKIESITYFADETFIYAVCAALNVRFSSRKPIQH